MSDTLNVLWRQYDSVQLKKKKDISIFCSVATLTFCGEVILPELEIH